MTKLVLKYHRLRGCHRLSGYPGMPRGGLQFLDVDPQILTRAPILFRLWCIITLLADLRHGLTIC